MSTVTAPPAKNFSDNDKRIIPFSRLVQVEMRKMADTRAGMWLLIIIGLATVVVSIIFAAVANKGTKNFEGFLQISSVPQGLLLPVLGIMLVTSEWGQRTVLSTLSLNPSRYQFIASKMGAAILVGLAALAMSVVVAALMTVVAGNSDPWSGVSVATFARFALGEVLMLVWGIAFGMLFLNSATAVTLFYVLPQVVSIIMNSWPAAYEKGLWFNFQASANVLFSGDALTGEKWAHILTGALIWICIPAAVGMWRILTSEIK